MIHYHECQCFHFKKINLRISWVIFDHILWSSDTYIMYQRKLVDLEIKQLGTYCSVSPT